MKSIADMTVNIETIKSKNKEVTVSYVFNNNTNQNYFLYGANACSKVLLDRNLFEITYQKHDIVEKLNFLGPIGEGYYGFIVLKPHESKVCVISLNFNYEFPKELGITYKVKYKIENPEYKNIQEKNILESPAAKFTR